MYKGDPALVTYWKRWKGKVYFSVFLYFAIFQPVWNSLISFFQAEVKTALVNAVKVQNSYFSDQGHWNDNYADLLVDFDPQGKYAYFLSPDQHQGRPLSELGISDVNFAALGAPVPGLREDGLVIVAVGNIDLDSELDVWWVDESLQLHNPRCDAWNFWKWVAVLAGWGERGEV